MCLFFLFACISVVSIEDYMYLHIHSLSAGCGAGNIWAHSYILHTLKTSAKRNEANANGRKFIMHFNTYIHVHSDTGRNMIDRDHCFFFASISIHYAWWFTGELFLKGSFFNVFVSYLAVLCYRIITAAKHERMVKRDIWWRAYMLACSATYESFLWDSRCRCRCRFGRARALWILFIFVWVARLY